jgi:hypothetical protein
MALHLVGYKTNFGYSVYFSNLVHHNSPMNNHVKYGTANLLKEAGFPIPN